MEVSVGMKVKVCSEEEGFRGAWFEGAIIAFGNDIHDKNTFFFQYENFITDDSNGEALVEEVYLKNMRPIPPYKKMLIDFSPGFVVEELGTDCWWRGIIMNKFISPFDGEEIFQIYASLKTGLEGNGNNYNGTFNIYLCKETLRE
ncbi:hypothetical protein SUGI_0081710 [Cryptomeria japonica]|nr:hypothetical protein SUGI_0081710 [Cryptomeria japonica]